MGLIASLVAVLGVSGVHPAAIPLEIADASPPGNEIVVTARRRAELPQRVPISLSLVDGKAIEALDIRNTTDLSGRSPNLLSPANAVAISTPTFFIRGVGEGDHNWNDENGVAFFIDDVYVQSPSAAWLDLTDMDRVEVLRGPQGTLYGRNAVSGAIKFVPRLPDPERLPRPRGTRRNPTARYCTCAGTPESRRRMRCSPRMKSTTTRKPMRLKLGVRCVTKASPTARS